MLPIKSNWYRNLIIVIIIVLVIALIYQARAVFLPLILSIGLAYVINPLVKLLERGGILTLRLSVPRWAAILIAYLFLGVAFSLIVLFTSRPLTNQTNKLVNNLPRYTKRLQRLFKETQANYLQYRLPRSWNKVLNQELEKIASSLLETTRKGVINFLKLFSHFIELFLVPILTFYLILDREKLKRGFTLAFPKDYRGEAEKLLEEVSQLLDRYVRGQLLLCAILAVVSTFVFHLLHLDFALIAGLFAGITKAIPIVGPIIGAVPAIFLALLRPDPLKTALWVLLFFSLVQFLENKIILPKVMEYYVKLHPATIIVALLAGGELGGILGMFVAVPVAAVIKVFYNHFYPRLIGEEKGEIVHSP